MTPSQDPDMLTLTTYGGILPLMEIVDHAAVAAIRAFNRFYTRQIGLLDEHLSDSPFTLGEARILYELATSDDLSAADLTRLLDIDKAQLSRILARFRQQGLLETRADPGNARRRLLLLTVAGRTAYAGLDAAMATQIAALVAPLTPSATRRLTDAMRDIATILGDAPAPPPQLRAPRAGDLGWVIHRQALLYAREYDWDWRYEALAADILGKFVADFDPAREHAWVAEQDGRIVGSIFLMRSDNPAVGKLRLLYVEPDARGLGLGRMLVAACVDRARDIGYRTLSLWTNDVLVSARRIYEAAGFTLAHQEAHHSFGHDLVGQTWTLPLQR